MTTGKPPKRRTVKRGRPAKAEGKKVLKTGPYFQRRIPNIQAHPAPIPYCTPKIKYISITKKSPRMGGFTTPQ